MKRTAALALIALAAVPLAFAKEAEVPSAWAAAPPSLNGDARDWEGQARALYKDAGVEYAFRNDGADLYALVVFKDRKGMSSLEQTGLTLWVSPEGRKKNLGVRFFRKNLTADELIADMEKRGETLTDARKAELRGRPSYGVLAAEVVNKKKAALAPYDPPAYRAAAEEGAVVFEVKLPLFGAAPGSPLKVGLEWGGMTAEMRQALMASRASDGARASQGASGMYVQDQGGEGGDYDGPGFMRGPRAYSFFVTVRLASAS